MDHLKSQVLYTVVGINVTTKKVTTKKYGSESIKLKNKIEQYN